MHDGPTPKPTDPDPEFSTANGSRVLFLCIGWTCVVIGAAGVALPVLPGTPFLIIALWAFSKSSTRFHDWLLGHRFLGPPIRRWREERVIPVHVKVTALSAMALSFSYLAFVLKVPWYVLTAVLGIMAIGAFYILKSPSRMAPKSEKAIKTPAE